MSLAIENHARQAVIGLEPIDNDHIRYLRSTYVGLVARALRFAVVDVFLVLGRDGQRGLGDLEGAFNVGDVVVRGDVLALAVHDLHRAGHVVRGSGIGDGAGHGD